MKIKPLSNADFKHFENRTSRPETADYWIKRAFRAEEAADKTTEELLRDMKKVYRNSLAEVEKEIQAFYGRYAEENGLTIQEVHRRLDPKQLKSAQEEIKRYYDFADPKKIGKNMSDEYRDELRRLSARAYMSRLEEIKARLKYQVIKLAAEENKAFEKAMKEAYADAHAQTSYTIDRGLGFSEGYSAPDEDTLDKVVKAKWLDRNYSDSIWEDKGRLLTSIENELLTGIARGQNPRKIAEAMATKYGQDYRNCERLARTETIHYMNEATYDSYKEHGVEKYQYVCGLDERTCPTCGAWDGRVEDVKYKVEGVNYPVMHPNCVLGDSVIIAPDAECLTKSKYSGDIFKFTASNGRSFSVTPNHIMLTTRGWVRAKNLIKGDKVIYYSAWDKIAVVGNPADNNRVPTIEQLFASLVESAPMMSRIVPATAEDFKGDVVKDSKIDIVLVDSLLRDKINSPLLKFLSDFALIETSEGFKGILNADCSLAKLLVCLGLVADGIMSGDSILDVIRFGTLTHHQLVGLRLPSDYNTRLIQTAYNSRSADIESFCKFIDADSAVVKADNLGNRQILAGVRLSDSDSVFSQNSSDGLLGTVENLSKFLNTLSAVVEFNEIIDIQVSKSTVHVYDVSSKSTLYICNGFISSNCRCTTIPFFEKDDIDALFEESTRVAYDEGRKLYDVPASMTYKEWKESVNKKG